MLEVIYSWTVCAGFVHIKMNLDDKNRIGHCSVFHLSFFFCRSGSNKRRDENNEAKKRLLENEIIIHPEHFKNFCVIICFTV